ncbi:hypothetical protein GMAR_ORF61 [Golden Marseillevirus]|uniref:hypothetical protein n=1 Tax=Golden Marseillevirus TaxID=1720526 RepID=UPI000877A9F5|nr:hypothetical protein GMAR_ORF61 [Golden Marseillevirus]ALX27436.1 hypothetical protein GMAR_ORF61 [Golden Marseillevirus]
MSFLSPRDKLHANLQNSISDFVSFCRERFHASKRERLCRKERYISTLKILQKSVEDKGISKLLKSQVSLQMFIQDYTFFQSSYIISQ